MCDEDIMRFEWESPAMPANNFSIFTDGLLFEYSDNTVSVYNAEGTHNLIHQYNMDIDTRINFEKEIAFWLHDYNM